MASSNQAEADHYAALAAGKGNINSNQQPSGIGSYVNGTYYGAGGKDAYGNLSTEGTYASPTRPNSYDPLLDRNMMGDTNYYSNDASRQPGYATYTPSASEKSFNEAQFHQPATPAYQPKPGDGISSGDKYNSFLALQQQRDDIYNQQSQHNADVTNRVKGLQALQGQDPYAAMHNPFTGAARDQFIGNQVGNNANIYGQNLQQGFAASALRGATPDSGIAMQQQRDAAFANAGANSQDANQISQNFLTQGDNWQQQNTANSQNYQGALRAGIANAQDAGYQANMFNPLQAQADLIRNQGAYQGNTQQAWQNTNTQQYQPRFQDQQLTHGGLENTGLGTQVQMGQGLYQSALASGIADNNYNASSAGYGQRAMGQKADYMNSPMGQMQQNFDRGTSFAGSALNNSMAYIKPIQQQAGQAVGFVGGMGMGNPFGGSGGVSAGGAQGGRMQGGNPYAMGPGY